jgi:GT2 family glycosyltransferase
MTADATVSVILPTLNERAFIRDCLDSLVSQDYGSVLEILVVDGRSTDGTRDIVASYGEPVRLLDNPRRTAAAALNIGLGEAKGDVFVRADAHTLYASDYVTSCLDVLVETGADNVGGPMRPVGITNFGRAVAAVTSSPYGVGPGKFHYSTSREVVDTVYLGCYHRQRLEELGGWDEDRLQWGAEDHELNFRLMQSGGVIVLDPAIRSWYFPRQEPGALGRQYFNYGVCKASTLAKHRRLPTWRPLVPAALVAGAAVGVVAFPGRWRAVLPAAYGALAGTIALSLGRDPGVAPHRAFAALGICHWSYGAGFWAGVARSLAGRPFESRRR